MIVEVDGVRYDVPDDATPEEIGSIAGPPPARKVPLGETVLGHAAQGLALGGAPKLVGLYEAGEGRGGETGNPLQTAADVFTGLYRRLRGDKGAEERYTKAKEAEKAYLEETRAAHPYAAFGSQVAGGGLPAALIAPMSAARGVPLLRRALEGATAGLKIGGVAGAASAEEPLDVLKSAGLGAVGGGVLPVAGAGLASLARPAVSRLQQALEAASINQGRKVLTGNAAPMATRKPLSPEAIQSAYDVGAIGPLGTVEKAAERLGVARETIGDRYGQILAALEAKGVTGPNAVVLAQRLAREADEIASQSLGSPAPGMYRGIAEELKGKVDPTPFASKRLGLTQAENMKRTLQRAAQSEYVKEGAQSLGGEAKTELASRLRQAVEDAVASQSRLAPEEAAAFEPVKQQLSRIIEASNAANRGAARAANRQTFGLGSKVLAGGALASGSVPGAVAALVSANALRNRGPATFGWLANRAAQSLKAPPMDPADAEMAALLSLLTGKPASLLAPVVAEGEPQDPRSGHRR